MGKTITLTEVNLESVLRLALKLGGMNLGVKQKLLVKRLMADAAQRATAQAGDLQGVFTAGGSQPPQPYAYGSPEHLERTFGLKGARLVPTSELNIIGGSDEMVEVAIAREFHDFRSPKRQINFTDELHAADWGAETITTSTPMPPISPRVRALADRLNAENMEIEFGVGRVPGAVA